jgi:hypothetical protein
MNVQKGYFEPDVRFGRRLTITIPSIYNTAKMINTEKLWNFPNSLRKPLSLRVSWWIGAREEGTIPRGI